MLPSYNSVPWIVCSDSCNPSEHQILGAAAGDGLRPPFPRSSKRRFRSIRPPKFPIDSFYLGLGLKTDWWSRRENLGFTFFLPYSRVIFWEIAAERADGIKMRKDRRQKWKGNSARIRPSARFPITFAASNVRFARHVSSFLWEVLAVLWLCSAAADGYFEDPIGEAPKETRKI